MKTIIAFLIATACALAGPIETGTLTLTGVNGQQADGLYVSPYTATLSVPTLGTEDLTVYCDDVLDQVSVGQSWEVNVYSGASTAGADYAASKYPVLFWLAGQDTPADYVTTQEAMWYETDPSFGGSTSASFVLLSEAISKAGSVDLSNWDVITPVTQGGQEFIVDAVRLSVTASPEPAAWITALLGLGMVGFGKFRRK